MSPKKESAHPEKTASGKEQAEATNETEVVRVRKRGLTRNNPFIIADQIAKAKLAEPHVCATTVQATLSPKLAQQLLPRPGTVHGKWTELPDTTASGNGKESLLKQLAVPKGKEVDRTEPNSLASTTGDSQQTRGTQASRRMKTLSHKPTSRTLERVMEVDVDAEGQGQVVPRLRVSSPPPWLKHPSNRPGSIEGRLQRVESKSTPYLSQRRKLDEARSQNAGKTNTEQDLRTRPTTTTNRDLDYRANLKHVVKRSPSSPAVMPEPVHKFEECSFCESGAPDQDPISGIDTSIREPEDETILGQETEDRPLARGETTQSGTVTSEKAKTSLQESDIMDVVSPSAVPTIVRGPDEELHHPMPLRHMSSKGVIETKERGGSSTVTVRRRAGRGSSSRGLLDDDDDDDVGIQGLTIVLHLKGKDDLVISRDLTREAE
ncbi:hypothetical protein QBC46DRAFT_337432 [Diplogelasinospora grovesii]|uniref:Uncharacterized protein n=1 Tax=Diplogelasinospora grovesii TaxID=303347 RepID=A0AAN6NFC1_9PEZI|nr:hypothetical protein QBC46DRAFT_337432 [Diplogelasinospora grovesii]